MATDEGMGLEDDAGSALDGIATGFDSALLDGSQALSPSPQTNMTIINLCIGLPDLLQKVSWRKAPIEPTEVYTWADVM